MDYGTRVKKSFRLDLIVNVQDTPRALPSEMALNARRGALSKQRKLLSQKGRMDCFGLRKALARQIGHVWLEFRGDEMAIEPLTLNRE